MFQEKQRAKETCTVSEGKGAGDDAGEVGGPDTLSTRSWEGVSSGDGRPLELSEGGMA